MPVNTLVDGYTFFVTSGTTELGSVGGLFHKDTRHLSTLDVDVRDQDLLPIGTTSLSPNERIVTLAPTSSTVNEINEENVPKHTSFVVTRDQRVREDIGLVETVTVDNHSTDPRTVALTIRFDSDFADLFEVRGLTRDIDRDVETAVGEQSVTTRYRYTGSNGTRYEPTTTVQFDQTPDSLDAMTATFELDVVPQETATVSFAATVDGETRRPETVEPRTDPVSIPAIETGNRGYDAVFQQAAADLTALTTDTEYGLVPLAGTPWFVTPFGRDSLIAAYQSLAVAPELAVGTLRFLAAHRGRETDDVREEAPGKIFHELRQGELANTGAVPHTPYYGTVDATALWVLLLDEVCAWRGDVQLASELEPALVDALKWLCEVSAQTAADPFIYYEASSHGLDHKAWKDTADSIRFADGAVAEGPLAVAEVQGYAAAALQSGANMLDRIDATDSESIATYRERGETIERAFNEAFWLPDCSFYGLAKDCRGHIVDAVSSNIGHCLWTETIPDSRVDAIVETLTGDELTSGWGIRTMSSADSGYSPVSYHAGGVWPHDTSLVALGLSKYGYGVEAERLSQSVLDAALHFNDERLPELYCGFDRGRDPVEYPAACTPQAWGAGAPFAFLRAVFALEPTGDGVQINRTPTLFDEEAVVAVQQRWQKEVSIGTP